MMPEDIDNIKLYDDVKNGSNINSEELNRLILYIENLITKYKIKNSTSDFIGVYKTGVKHCKRDKLFYKLILCNKLNKFVKNSFFFKLKNTLRREPKNNEGEYYKHGIEKFFSIINFKNLKIVTILGFQIKVKRGAYGRIKYQIQNFGLNFQKMPNAFISVIMPVYNTEEEYLRGAIESILNQTYKNFEFVIVNDGSTNNAEEVILSYKDERIKYYKNDTNKGLQFVRNRLISLVKGKYIACMDSDDTSYPKRFEKQIKFLEKHADVGVLGTQLKFFGEENYVTEHKTHPNFVDMFNSGWEVNNATVMMRSDLDIEYNPYPIAEDYDLWMNLASKNVKFANLDEVLYDCRLHGNNTTIIKRTLMQNIQKKIKAITLAKYFDLDYKFIQAITENEKLTTEEIDKFNSIVNIIEEKTKDQRFDIDIHELYKSFV